VKIYLIIPLLFFHLPLVGQGLIINEFLSDNYAGLQDLEGNYNDWIELYNNSDQVINVLNFGLSDDLEHYNKWTFPNLSIEPYQYFIIFASGNNTSTETELHTNFKIKQLGEPLILTNNVGAVLSLIEPVFVPTDHSFARITDGHQNMTVSNMPTPNSSNSNFTNLYCSHPSGFYTDSFDLCLLSSNTNHKIYYTLNGDQPTVNSTLYTRPISIKSNQQKPLNYSLIPTTPLTGPKQLNEFIWKEPKSVYRCNIVRFGFFENDILQGAVQTRNFFVDNEIEDRYQFPIVAIATDSVNLFDYNTGIYIPGKRFDEKGFNWWPEGNYLNRGKAWERKMHLTYFENNGLLAFETDAGMRMRGFSSVSYPQKSFTTYFRNEYGRSNIEYPIFKNNEAQKYKRLLFRNAGNDFIYTHFRDAMLQNIIEPLDLELQAFQPAVVFINGEYWGIHNIREKYDQFYFKYKFDIEEDDINILTYCGEVEEGDNIEYNELIDFIERSDLSTTENYNYVSNKLDVQNFIDFQIAEIYFANYDWPCNNFKIWKDNTPSSKWRFLIYDLDYSFGYDYEANYTTNSIEHAVSTDSDWPHCECSNIIFRRLLLNDEFEKQFLNRFSYCLKTIFETSNVIAVIDAFKLKYATEIEEHINRWNYPSTVKDWEEEVNKYSVFATERPCYISEHIRTYFNLNTPDFDCVITNLNANEVLPIFPNPNSGDFEIFNNSSQDIENGSVTIIDSFGRTVYLQEDISININERHRFNFENLVNGLYIFSFESNEISERKKIIIK